MVLAENVKYAVEGVRLIKLQKYDDQRGSFMEVMNAEKYKQLGLEHQFVQQNQAMSYKGVLRGMHCQRNNPQGKLISVAYGAIYDAFVDLRKDSPTFGRWDASWLIWNDQQGPYAIYLPPGVAHGYYTSSNIAMLNYLCTTTYDQESDGGIIYNDSTVGIHWPFADDFNPIISMKDKSLPTLEQHGGI